MRSLGVIIPSLSTVCELINGMYPESWGCFSQWPIVCPPYCGVVCVCVCVCERCACICMCGLHVHAHACGDLGWMWGGFDGSLPYTIRQDSHWDLDFTNLSSPTHWDYGRAGIMGVLGLWACCRVGWVLWIWTPVLRLAQSALFLSINPSPLLHFHFLKLFVFLFLFS